MVLSRDIKLFRRYCISDGMTANFEREMMISTIEDRSVRSRIRYTFLKLNTSLKLHCEQFSCRRNPDKTQYVKN